MDPEDLDDNTDGDTGEQKPEPQNEEETGSGEQIPQTPPNNQEDEEYQPDPVEDLLDDFDEE